MCLNTLSLWNCICLARLLSLCTSLTAALLSPQVTKGMFGARKKFEFVEVVDNDFNDESMYYSQPSMFPHRSDKDVSFVPIPARFCQSLSELHLQLSHSVLSSNVFLQMLSSPSPSSSGQLSQLGASLYGPQSKGLFVSMSLYCSLSIIGVKRNLAFK